MKIRNLLTVSVLLLIIGISSCRDDFDFDQASDELGFSTDTVSLDTVFNHTNSQTYKLTIHNRQDDDVEIPKIFLSRGESSFYKLNVDGMPGYSFENVPVRANDSIFIFVEVAAGEAPVNPLYEDEINFETTNGTQQVKLMSWIEKALFYNTELVENYSLGNVDWNNEYSRVIYGNVTAENFNATPGTKVYFHSNASLTVNGIMNVNGTLGNEVRFRSDRHDERSDSLPNMWGKIKIKSPNLSDTSNINYAIIKGGNIGLEVENSTLNISNTKILNNDYIGLYAIRSTVTGKNLVINNSDLTALGIEGGSYDFRHCTFGNYHDIGQGAGGNYSLILSNTDSNNSSAPIISAKFYNSIFYGRAIDAIHIDEGITQYDFDFNVIRGTNPINATNTIDADPLFVNPGFGTNDLRLQELNSEVVGHASTNWLDPITNYDILNMSRTSNPNPGAYQVLVPEE